MITDQIVFNYYKFFSKNGLKREAAYSYRSGWLAPEDKTFRLFCLSFLCWLILLALSINFLVYNKFRTPNGFIICLLFIPFYVVYSKRYTTDFEIIGIYERMKNNIKATGVFATIIYTSSLVIITAAAFAIAILNIK